jgi:hypothetical protein
MCTLRAAPLSPLAAAAPVPPQPVAGICLAQRRQGDRRRYGEGRGVALGVAARVAVAVAVAVMVGVGAPPDGAPRSGVKLSSVTYHA